MADRGASRWSLNGPGVRLWETEPKPIVVLRVRARTGETLDALGRAFALAWPSEPNTVARSEGVTVAWTAPGEWTLFGLTASDAARLAAEACGGRLHHMADVAGGCVTFGAEGPRAREVIARACPIDLHPRRFAANACAQSLFAGVPALLRREGDGWLVHADSSVRTHLRAWLAQAVRNLAA